MKRYDDEFPLLQPLGLYAADIRGDGNCLFNALSDQIYGHQNEHHTIRARVIDYMREHADYFKQFVDVYPGGGTRRNPKRKSTAAGGPSNTAPSQADIDRVFESHLHSMAQGGTYGDNMEITAFSRAFNIDVKIYQRDVAFMVTGGLDSPDGVAHIAYHTWEHYSSIRNLDGPHTGLPEVHQRSLSPETLAQQSPKLARASFCQPWMLKQLASSLPYFVGEATIRQTLEHCRGNLDAAYSMLLDEDSESRSISSTQDSSSAERDPDDDKTSVHRAVRRAKRRSIRLSKHIVRSRSQDSGLGTDSDISAEPPNNGTGPAAEETSSALKPSHGRRGTPDESRFSPAKTSGRRGGPLRITARDKKELKKQAQKAARKQRQQESAVDKVVPGSKMQAGMALRERRAGDTPPIESGLRTLFI